MFKYKFQEGVFMQKNYFNFPSVTFAMKSEKLLKSNGINCSLVKTPSRYSGCGCGYSIITDISDSESAKKIILAHNIVLNDVKSCEE